MVRQEKELSNSLTLRNDMEWVRESHYFNFSWIVWVNKARKNLEALKSKATSTQNEPYGPRRKGASDPSGDCYRGIRFINLNSYSGWEV